MEVLQPAAAASIYISKIKQALFVNIYAMQN